MSKRILYKPTLKIDKHYETDGRVTLNKNVIEELSKLEQQHEFTKLEILAETISNFNYIIQELPESLKDNVQNMMDLIQFIFVQIDPSVIPGEKNENGETVGEDPDLIITQPDDEESDKDDEEYDWLVCPLVPVANINKAKRDDVKLIDKYYSGSLLEIIDDYLKKMKEVTNKYFTDMGVVLKESDLETLNFITQKYTFKTTDLEDKNLQHVSDFIIKSQIVRDQKTRMFNKLFNKSESLNKIKACEGARELYIRYLREQKLDTSTYMNLLSNMTLEQSKLIYERKIEENLYELYKYLNSSVIVLDECFKLYIKEAQSKLLIIQKEGITL